MGTTLALVAEGVMIVGLAIDIGMRAYNFVEEKIIKAKKCSKQKNEDQYKFDFQNDFRQDREIMNDYKRQNQKYNKMCNSLRDYRGYEENEDKNEFEGDYRQKIEIMNYYQRRNQKYNKMCDRWRDYRGYDKDNFDYH